MSPFSRISTILVLSVCSPILGQEVKDSKAVAPKKSIYDAKADAREQDKAATRQGRATGSGCSSCSAATGAAGATSSTPCSPRTRRSARSSARSMSW